MKLKEFFGQFVKPGEEDFYVVSIVTGNKEFPTWDERYSTHGTQAKVNKALDVMEPVLPFGGVKVQIFQGDFARAFLEEAKKQEEKFNVERQGQSRN